MRRAAKCIIILLVAGALCFWFAHDNYLLPTRTDKLLRIAGIKAHDYFGKAVFHDYWMDILGYTDGYELLIIPTSCIDTIQPYEWRSVPIYLSQYQMVPFRGMSDEMWNETYEKSASFTNGEDEYTIMLSEEHCAVYRAHHKACI